MLFKQRKISIPVMPLLIFSKLERMSSRMQTRSTKRSAQRPAKRAAKSAAQSAAPAAKAKAPSAGVVIPHSAANAAASAAKRRRTNDEQLESTLAMIMNRLRNAEDLAKKSVAAAVAASNAAGAASQAGSTRRILIEIEASDDSNFRCRIVEPARGDDESNGRGNAGAPDDDDDDESDIHSSDEDLVPNRYDDDNSYGRGFGTSGAGAPDDDDDIQIFDDDDDEPRFAQHAAPVQRQVSIQSDDGTSDSDDDDDDAYDDDGCVTEDDSNEDLSYSDHCLRHEAKRVHRDLDDPNKNTFEYFISLWRRAVNSGGDETTDEAWDTFKGHAAWQRIKPILTSFGRNGSEASLDRHYELFDAFEADELAGLCWQRNERTQCAACNETPRMCGYTTEVGPIGNECVIKVRAFNALFRTMRNPACTEAEFEQRLADLKAANVEFIEVGERKKRQRGWH